MGVATVAAGLNAILWIALVIFPFIQVPDISIPIIRFQMSHSHSTFRSQAARVTNACNKLISTGPEVRARPLQYTNTPQIELDSYVTLTQAVRMRVS